MPEPGEVQDVAGPVPILHHYDISPYSHIIRVILGIKCVTWRSCVPPVIAPKPDLVALTGGYRRVPVLQVGADIYCDSQLIMRVLDRMYPAPSLETEGSGALAFMLGHWFQSTQVRTIVPLLFRDGRTLDSEFSRDRELLMERPFVDIAAWQSAAPHAEDSLRAQLGWLEAVLADGRTWLSGEGPGLLEALAFPNIAFFEALAGDIPAATGMDHLAKWKQRVHGIGQGTRTEIAASEAIEEAARSMPVPGRGIEGGEARSFEPYEVVAVRADDYGRDRVQGKLVGLSQQCVSIMRHDPRAGDVTVHFPRHGFEVTRVTR